MKRTGAFWEGCLFVLLLSVAMTVPAEGETQCRNRIPELGGRTAIRRGDPLDTIEKLRKVLGEPETPENKKYRRAFKEILDQAGMAGTFDDFIKVIETLKPGNLQSYSQGTELEWMAYRRDGKIRLLNNACWVNDEPFRAWTFDFKGRKLLIPEDCLNLAELKTPTCQIQAQTDCSTSKVTAKVAVEPIPGYRVQSVGLTSSLLSSEGAPPQPKDQGDKTAPPFEWTFGVEESGTYRLAAKVTAVNPANQEVTVESPSCTAEVKVCKPVTVKQCDPPVCRLEVKSYGLDGLVSLWISAEGSEGKLTVTAKKVGGDMIDLKRNGSIWTATIPQKNQATYEVALQAEPVDSNCKPMTCSTVVPVGEFEANKMEKLSIEEEVQWGQCCESPWILRTFGLYTAAQGSEAKGTFRTPDEKFKLDFNQGLGFGLDLEYLLTKRKLQGSHLSRWGWSFGLSRVTLDTTWTLDSSAYWIMDDDQVPMLSLTTGPRYHWGREGRDWSLYASPVLAFVRFDSATFANGTPPKPGTFKADFEDRFAYGVDFGFDAFLRECWGLTGGIQYLKLSTSAGDIDVDVDPLTLRAGVVYRF